MGGSLPLPPFGKKSLPDKERAPGVDEIRSANWIVTRPLADPTRAKLIPDLDRGETEVLGLALELHADLVIMDERLGRRHARRLGLSLTGTLGVLLKAKKKGLIPNVGALASAMQAHGFRLADTLVTRTLAMAGE